MVKYKNPRHELEAQEVEQIEEFEKEMKQPAATVEETVWKNRYGDLRRHVDQKQRDADARVQELENKLEQALRGQLKAPKSDGEIEAWMKEYPEFASILETLVSKRINEATSKTQKKFEELEQKESKMEAEKSILALKKLHPDLDELTRSEEFHKWLTSQRKKYQDAIYNSLDVDEADFVISKYKAEKGKSSKVDDEGQDFSGAAKVVRTSNTVEEPASFGDYEFSESQIEKESKRNRKWYEQNEAKIATAIQKGKFLYDVTGGAR